MSENRKPQFLVEGSGSVDDTVQYPVFSPRSFAISGGSVGWHIKILSKHPLKCRMEFGFPETKMKFSGSWGGEGIQEILQDFTCKPWSTRANQDLDKALPKLTQLPVSTEATVYHSQTDLWSACDYLNGKTSRHLYLWGRSNRTFSGLLYLLR